jgi:hypothetical protein
MDSIQSYPALCPEPAFTCNLSTRRNICMALQIVGALSLLALACKLPLPKQFQVTLRVGGLRLRHAELFYEFADDFYRGLDFFQRQEFVWLMRLIDRTRSKHHNIHS